MTLEEIVSGTFHRTGRFQVLGSSDIISLLQHEEQKMPHRVPEDSEKWPVGYVLVDRRRSKLHRLLEPISREVQRFPDGLAVYELPPAEPAPPIL